MNKVLFICNGSGKMSGNSGGTIRLIELIKYLQKKNKYTIEVLTTEGLKILFKKENLKVKQIILKSNWFSKSEKNSYDRLFSNIITLIDFFFQFKKIKKNYDIVYTSSDYIFDIIPAILYKIFYKSVIFSIIHHEIIDPWHRQGNKFINLISFFFQKLSFFLINNFSDYVFLYDTPEGKKISEKIYVKKSFILNGISQYAFKKKKETKKYDICFVGGLRESKGIFYFIELSKKLRLLRPNLKVLIIGHGSKILTNKIKYTALVNKFKFIPGLKNKDVIKKIAQTKILVSTSREEGWGIVLLEAMSAYTLVIANYLIAFKSFRDFGFFYNYDDEQEIMKNKILSVLKNYKDYKKKLFDAKKFSNNFHWNTVLNIDYKIFNFYFLRHRL